MKINKISIVVIFSVSILHAKPAKNVSNSSELTRKFYESSIIKDEINTDIAVIGSGPAGMSASVYLNRAKIDHVVIEGTTGGQLMKAAAIKNWPGKDSITGIDLATKIRKHTESLGTRYISGEVVKINFDKNPFELIIKNNDQETIIRAKCIIIATGNGPKKLNIPGEDEYLGKGIALCASCDAPLFENKKVIVIGGGFEALREIGTLSKYTAPENITIINNGSELCGPKMLLNFISPEMRIIHNAEPLEIIGDGEKATGVRIKMADGQEETLNADGIFIATGKEPNVDFLEGRVKLNDKNEIDTTRTKTSVPGVFAGGDVSSESYHQAPLASAQGYQAAMEAEKYLLNTSDNNCRKQR